ncbi:MAG: ribosomal RNA small subunit methyltransferase A, partial [Mycoplasmataceae bacterium]|nr:ribosomal RNA small subunit methyltransferase A [Mycoplasmataceae bacterium]
MNLNEIRMYLKQNNFVPSKKMGQNFLIDNNIAQNIVSSIHFQPFDLIVEIGPGLGAITEALIKINKPIIAIELDKRLFAQLNKQ